MNKQQRIERVQSAKSWLTKDSDYLEKIKNTGSKRSILTIKARIRIHTLVIQMTKI